jgi:DNA polymerase-3 subunit delta'
MLLAKTLLCPERPAAEMNPCGRCPSCLQVEALTHPDIYLVEKPDDKSDIPVKLLIGDLEHRMKEGLVHDIGLKPLMGGRKVAIIDDADHLNDEGANCLLKVLEEPPPGSVLILIGTSPSKQLPTIRSRAQLIRFNPLAAEDVAQLLIATGAASDPAEARRMAEHGEGSVARAIELADPALWDFRRRLLEQLAASPLDNVALSRTVLAFVDEAGKEAPPRRARLRLIVGFSVEFYRLLLRRMTGAPAEGDADLLRSVEGAIRAWRGGIDRAASAVERCLDALAHIERNAHQSMLVDCWLDDVAA